MKMELPEIRPEERTPLVESLLAIIQQLLDRVQQLEETVQQLRDEIAVLKGQKPRPQIRPSQLESSRPSTPAQAKPRSGSPKDPANCQLVIHDEPILVLAEEDLPAGYNIKGYEPYTVQTLVIEVRNIRYWRTRYQLPDGTSLLAPLPSDVPPGSHYDSTLLAFILHQYYHGHVTQPLLLEQLHDFGVVISAGELNHILTEKKELFHQEKDEVRGAGLETARYIGADDTGARHQGRNGYCTAIGNDLFTCFASTASKSRLNLLQVMHGRQRLYAINEMTQVYWEEQGLAAAVVEKLRQGAQQFMEDSPWQARLAELNITSERHVRIASEGALLGGLIERGVSPDLAVLSDGAPQFEIFVHASCWIHAERPLIRMVPYNDAHRDIIASLRQQIWELYRDLKAYKQHPDPAHKPTLEARFDSLCAQEPGYPSLKTVLKEMQAHKADLLRVLDRPEVPLHNNAMESDIREYVKKRKISGGTRSDAGRHCRDTFISLKKTCRKLGINFWSYLQDRLRGLGKIPRLADVIRQRAAEDQAVPVEAVLV
jgi:hypothetical protein